MKFSLLVSALFWTTGLAQENDEAAPLAFDPKDTALVLTDLQNDFLSPDGVTWGVVGESVIEHDTVNNLERLLQAARDMGYLVFISPHYYYPHDHEWEFEGALEKLMHAIGMFDRVDPLNLEGFEGSGADWLEQYKEYIDGDNVIVTSPHKVYGPEQNDLNLQLRKRKIDRVILGGMSANLCVEAHMRELLEQGFEISVVSDATAAANIPEMGDGYAAALTNFKFIASNVVNTTQAIEAMALGATPAEDPTTGGDTTGGNTTAGDPDRNLDNEEENGEESGASMSSMSVITSVGFLVVGAAWTLM